MEGNPSAASTSFFHVINQLKEDPAQSEGRVFFIEISGGLELNGPDSLTNRSLRSVGKWFWRLAHARARMARRSSGLI